MKRSRKKRNGLALRRAVLRAARSIAEGRQDYSCVAVNEFCSWREHLRYTSQFAGEAGHTLFIEDIRSAVHGREQVPFHVDSNCEGCRSFRVFMLCMFAAARKHLKVFRVEFIAPLIR